MYIYILTRTHTQIYHSMLAAIQQLATGQSVVRPDPWAAQPAASPYDDAETYQGMQDNRESV
jgi:hypothetical protein